MKIETRRGKLLIIAETEQESQTFVYAFGPDAEDPGVKVQGRFMDSGGSFYLVIGKQTEEQRNALRVAKQVLDQPAANPTDDLALLAQKVAKQDEAIAKLERALVAQQDPHRDLVNANRDTILAMHEEAIRRLRRCLRRGLGFDSGVPGGLMGGLEVQLKTMIEVFDALDQFHPMHEDWVGFPKESDA